MTIFEKNKKRYLEPFPKGTWNLFLKVPGTFSLIPVDFGDFFEHGGF